MKLAKPFKRFVQQAIIHCFNKGYLKYKLEHSLKDLYINTLMISDLTSFNQLKVFTISVKILFLKGQSRHLFVIIGRLLCNKIRYYSIDIAFV